MATLLQIDFPFQGPFGTEMATALAGLAADIAAEPGLLWKIWTENAATGEAGGVYLFADEARARAYLAKHGERLRAFGITGIDAHVFDVNDALTRTTRGPLA